ncbi:sugar ABC transporter permease (plasmid) [Thalassococcus sp. S3]|nr:sugar ABC transporter permease [Thalassococcus sp. S3]
MALMLREMSTTYGRSPGGYIWAVLEPVAAIGLLTIVFSLVLKSPGLGTNFPLFYATGYLPFSFYQQVAGKTGAAIGFSKPLLAYPGVTYVDSIIARFMLNALTNLMIMYIVFTGIIIVYDTRSIIDVMSLAQALAMSAALGLGIGCLNCYLGATFPIWGVIWTVINRPLFIASCIFFTFDQAPRFAQDFLWWNPLVHIVGMMRRGFYPTYDAGYVSTLYVYSIAIVTMCLGLILLHRYHKDILND